MMNDDLISREAAIDKIEEYLEEYSELEPETGYHNLKWCAMEEAKDVLLMLPAVDAVQVVHGEWKWSHGGQCSECGFHNSNFDYNYCPCCGAKMDGGEDKEHGAR